MNLEDLILVSVDDHVVEPADLFVGRMPKRFADDAPRVIHNDDGTDVWVYQGVTVPYLGLNAVAGRPPEEYHMEPSSYDEFRPGCYDVHERIKDMSANGVLGSLNFPSFPRFCGQLFTEAATEDRELALAVIQAYNDWHIEGWCGAYPDRFIPMAIMPLWDPELMATEIHRVADLGCHAVAFSMNPYRLGLPSLHSDHWDPFWRACEAREIVVCMHIGSGSFEVVTSPDAPFDVRITCSGINIYPTAADLVWSPIFRKFDGLKVALSEGGIGWIPYFLERADYTYKHHRGWTGQDLGDKLPSDVFKEHVIPCFIDDQFGAQHLEWMNPDMVTWECDYPHSDTTWPQSPETLAESIRGLSDDLVANITHRNAMRLFHFDPFAIRASERCTVGALRAEVAGHDISVVSRGVRERRTTSVGAVLDAVEAMSGRHS